MRKINISAGDAETSSYIINKELDLLEELLSGTSCSSVHLIADRNAAPEAERMLPGIFSRISDTQPVLLDVSEAAKTLDTVSHICARLTADGADRDSVLVGIGGGITTDITGFVASVYKRGVRFVNVPTTLLAQIDASVGGKNGVNLGGLKNMIGTVRQPLFTYVSPDFLKSLPDRQLREGVSEMLKVFIITDEQMYGNALSVFSRDSISDLPYEDVVDLIYAAASAKISIVSRDCMEHGVRQMLNLGHTFGHAIEYVSSGGISHGEAVAMGTVMAARVSFLLGLSDRSLPEQLIKDFTAASLIHSEFPSPPSLYGAMCADKKKHGTDINLILPECVGKVCVHPVPETELQSILEKI